MNVSGVIFFLSRAKETKKKKKTPDLRLLLCKNLFSLKFETGSYFLKSIYKKKSVHLSNKIKSTFRILFGDAGSLTLLLQ